MSSSLSWTEQILGLPQSQQLNGRTCKTYVKQSDKEVCQCGRLKVTHSLASIPGKILEERTDHTKLWNELRDSTQVPIQVFGILPLSGAKFVRCDNRLLMDSLYALILADRDRTPPSLLISAFGGAKYFTLNKRLQKDLVAGIIDLATRAGT